MRNQTEPAASEIFHSSCERDLAESIETWRRRGGSLRGSPTRWGHPCRGATAESWAATPSPKTSHEDPRFAFPAELGRAVWLSSEPGWQFDDQTLPLWQIAEVVRPDLDDAIFRDVWPAVDAVALHRGPAAVDVFVNGDGVTLHVPLRDGRPDLSVAEEIRDALLPALEQERRIDAWRDGERLSVRYRPAKDRYDVDALLEMANALLADARSELRVARIATDVGFRVQIATPEQIARARARGFLAP